MNGQFSIAMLKYWRVRPYVTYSNSLSLNYHPGSTFRHLFEGCHITSYNYYIYILNIHIYIYIYVMYIIPIIIIYVMYIYIIYITLYIYIYSNVNPGLINPCLIGRVPFKFRSWLLEEYPLINKPWFINPGLTLHNIYLHINIHIIYT